MMLLEAARVVNASGICREALRMAAQQRLRWPGSVEHRREVRGTSQTVLAQSSWSLADGARVGWACSQGQGS